MSKQSRKLAILFLIWSSAWSGEQGNWAAHDNYRESEETEKAFSIARDYYLANSKKAEEEIDYKYNVYPLKNSLVVSITPLYKEANGEYFTVVDGDMCVYVGASFKIKGMRQCLAPAMDLVE